jgi:hypothetical protein
MKSERQQLLDRVFARGSNRGAWSLVPDVWTPPWRPRGRWWFRPRLPRGERGLASAASRRWAMLGRQTRAC